MIKPSMTDPGRRIFESILCDKFLRFRGQKPERYATIGQWAMAEAKKIVEMFEPGIIIHVRER